MTNIIPQAPNVNQGPWAQLEQYTRDLVSGGKNRAYVTAAAACPMGYRDTVCEACGCSLYVPVGPGGDVLCPQCQRQGEALAAEDAAAATNDDHDPRPPASGAMHPDYPHFAALASRILDDQLCEAIGVADGEPATFHLHTPAQRQAFVEALSAEVVRRLEGRRAA